MTFYTYPDAVGKSNQSVWRVPWRLQAAAIRHPRWPPFPATLLLPTASIPTLALHREQRGPHPELRRAVPQRRADLDGIRGVGGQSGRLEAIRQAPADAVDPARSAPAVAGPDASARRGVGAALPRVVPRLLGRRAKRDLASAGCLSAPRSFMLSDLGVCMSDARRRSGQGSLRRRNTSPKPGAVLGGAIARGRAVAVPILPPAICARPLSPSRSYSW